MKRVCLSIVFVWLLASFAFAQSAQQVPPNPSPSAAPAAGSDADIKGAFATTLVKGLDTKKLKEGDTVICQTSGVLRSRNGIMIPSGSKVIGHVTKVDSKSKGAAMSSLAISFDKIEVSKGKEFAMKGVLQAVGPSLGSSAPDTGSMSGSGQMMSGHGGTTEQAPPSEGAVAGPNSGVHPIAGAGTHAILIPDSQGVLGLKNLQMDKDSTLTSSEKDIKLESGTQMMIRAEISMPVQ